MAQSSIYVDPNDLKMVNEDIQRLLKNIRNKQQRLAYTKEAAIIVRDKARELAPVANPRQRDNSITRQTPPKKLRADVLYTYKAGGKRAGKGKGVITGKYGIGNLQLSIKVINDFKKIKAPVAIVGPLKNNKKSIVKPTERNTNGWYAQMIYGSSDAFGKRITNMALVMTAQSVFNSIASKITKDLNSFKAKNQIIR